MKRLLLMLLMLVMLSASSVYAAYGDAAITAAVTYPSKAEGDVTHLNGGLSYYDLVQLSTVTFTAADSGWDTLSAIIFEQDLKKFTAISMSVFCSSADSGLLVLAALDTCWLHIEGSYEGTVWIDFDSVAVDTGYASTGTINGKENVIVTGGAELIGIPWLFRQDARQSCPAFNFLRIRLKQHITSGLAGGGSYDYTWKIGFTGYYNARK